jgi:GWxTD domain-containing protein
MKRILLSVFAFGLFAFSSSFAQDLRAELALTRFDSPNDGPYLETYLRFDGSSLTQQESDEGVYCEVVISCTVSKDGTTVFEDNYKVKGPIVAKGKAPADFIDQQRIPMKNGKHEMVMTIRDLHNPEGKEAKITQEVTIEQKLLKVFISDVQLVDAYSKTETKNVLSKAGYDLVPYTSNYYPEAKKELIFYTEIYNTNRKIGTDDEFLVNMFVENSDDGQILDGLRTFMKRKGELVVPILHSFPLSDVPTGNYNLVIEARDRKNEVLDRTVMPFQRINKVETEYVMSEGLSSDDELALTFVGKYNRPEELEEYLRCLHPISTQEEIHHVNRKMNFNDPNMMKRFMYNFWKQRNPDNPEEAWLKYSKEVEKVNANYSTNLLKGYDTDRGRVYLQYGPPNTISPNYFEPNTYPYEIWHYYVLRDHLSADQSNRKFIFASTEQGSGEFDLIHSDAKNEPTNIRWNYDLHKRSTSTIDLDQENTGDHYGGRSKDFFENPY